MEQSLENRSLEQIVSNFVQLVEKQKLSENAFRLHQEELQKKCYLLEEKNKVLLSRLETENQEKEKLKLKFSKAQKYFENFLAKKQLEWDEKNTYLENKNKSLLEEKTNALEKIGSLMAQASEKAEDLKQITLKFNILESKVENYIEKEKSLQLALYGAQKKLKELHAVYREVCIQNEQQKNQLNEYKMSWSQVVQINDTAKKVSQEFSETKTLLRYSQEKLQAAEEKIQLLSEELNSQKAQCSQINDLFLKERREKQLLLQQLQQFDSFDCTVPFSS